MPWATTHDGNNLWDIMLKIMLVIGLSFFYNNYQTTINFQHHTLNLNSPFLLEHGSIGNFDVTIRCEYANATPKSINNIYETFVP
jgi:hypothetical protein